MTTNELVAQFIKALKDGVEDVEVTFSRYGAKRIINTEDREVWSVALNWDTLDVRYVEVDGGQGTVREVFPHTTLRTEYVGV